MGSFSLVGEFGRSGLSSALMTRLVPAPVEGQPDRAVYGWREYNKEAREDSGAYVVSIYIARAVITAVLPLGIDASATDVVVGPDGKVYVSVSREHQDGPPNEVVVYCAAADLSGVEWKQTFNATPSERPGYESGLQGSGMTFSGGKLVVAAGLRAVIGEGTPFEGAVPTPTFSISDGRADTGVALSMISDTVSPRDRNGGARRWPQDILLLLLDPTTGGLAEEPRVVGTQGLDYSTFTVVAEDGELFLMLAAALWRSLAFSAHPLGRPLPPVCSLFRLCLMGMGWNVTEYREVVAAATRGVLRLYYELLNCFCAHDVTHCALV